ncbi:hypothetical protein Pmani_022900 [Petrolisthes manimaculis]|uniref:Uncharacterized protein n=1 Tax=Petrolisthes manimaculis TaxID=1843537 RepID=A0AAE1PDL1_9EUCA|nr:hypothetical protein Pmani_022900 [Petrolisthes manimaculis]
MLDWSEQDKVEKEVEGEGQRGWRGMEVKGGGEGWRVGVDEVRVEVKGGGVVDDNTCTLQLANMELIITPGTNSHTRSRGSKSQLHQSKFKSPNCGTSEQSWNQLYHFPQTLVACQGRYIKRHSLTLMSISNLLYWYRCKELPGARCLQTSHWQGKGREGGGGREAGREGGRVTVDERWRWQGGT